MDPNTIQKMLQEIARRDDVKESLRSEASALLDSELFEDLQGFGFESTSGLEDLDEDSFISEVARNLEFHAHDNGRDFAPDIHQPESTPLRTPTWKSSPRIGRFPNLGLVGRGGMGEVYRVRDPRLQRRMVIKILRPDHLDDADAVRRFVEEGQITSQLAHPGVVPVYESGVLDEGRPYFTMREVRGRTFSEVIEEAHDNFAELDPSTRSWETSFRGLVELFQRVCEPVAYAHTKGVIHRDLKPSNIMIGDFGEVQILDWGLAKLIQQPADSNEGTEHTKDTDEYDTPASIKALTREDIPSIPPQLSASLDENSDVQIFSGTERPSDSLQGQIVGTPIFMPPEQARGLSQELRPPADVYALGVILFILLEGSYPFNGPNTPSILLQVIEGIPHPPGVELGAPRGLIDICMKATALEPEDRFPTAKELADAIAEWRLGLNRRQQALKEVEAADELIPNVDVLMNKAADLHARSRSLLTTIDRAAPIAEKRSAWSLQDEADFLTREADVRRTRVIQHLESALSYDPHFKAAHNRLATLYYKAHRRAEEERNTTDATKYEILLRNHDQGDFSQYLAAQGKLFLSTTPPDARVELLRFVQDERRLRPSLRRPLGLSPINGYTLPTGSYLLELKATYHQPLRYPILIGRSEDWGTPQAPPVRLLRLSEINDGEIFIPAGPFLHGHPEASYTFPLEEVWLDDFIIQRDPVTHADYLQFLNHLIANGEEDKALEHVPRNEGSLTYDDAWPLYQRTSDGFFAPGSDDDEFLSLPCNLISWLDAQAYARWYSQETGYHWHLPTEDDWEKAARGVDGRFFPWGDFLDPTWCRMLHSARKGPHPVPTDRYPEDISVYGVRGMAGNIRDWCLPNDFNPDTTPPPEQLMPFRGGCWFSTPELCNLSYRELKPAHTRSSGTGFRLVRRL